MKIQLTLLTLALVLSCAGITQLHAQSSAFTYQGRLNQTDGPASGSFDMSFSLVKRKGIGTITVATTTNLNVTVSDGLFTTELDFPRVEFDQDDYYLEIGVRPARSRLNFTPLSPRQKLTPTPQAQYARKAGGMQSGANPVFTGTATFDPSSGPPFQVGSSTKVPQLNADQLDGYSAGDFVKRSGDTMTGRLDVNTGNRSITLSDHIGSGSFSYDVAVNAQVDSGLGIGVRARATGIGGTGVNASSSGEQGTGVYGEANVGTNAKGIYGRSTGGWAGYIEGGVKVRYASPFSKAQLALEDPSTKGFARLRMQTGDLPFWDIALGSSPGMDNTLRFFNTDHGDVMWVTPEGQLHTRVLTIMGGADIAEPFKMTEEELPEGSVVVIDDEHPGHLKQSTQAYDTRVAGVISGAGGVNPGLQLQQQGVMEGDQPVALTGRVYVQADAESGSIKPGDLLTTASTPGHAMKVNDHARAQGAILGKAMTSLTEGTGLVLVLVTLQ